MTGAHDLALRYDQYVSALWRGDTAAAHAFGAWMEAHWRGDGPPEPDSCPDALSVCGGAGKGIRWYTTTTAVLGYVSGRRGCYQVAITAVPPILALTLESAVFEGATP